MSVTTLVQLDCKMNAHFKKNSQLVYGRGSFMSESKHYQPHLSPYVAKQLTAQFHNHSSAFFSTAAYSTNGILHILVKAQPSTRSTGPWSTTGLGIWSQDLCLPNEYSLGHCGLSAVSRHKLAFTSRHYELLTANLTLQHSTKAPRLKTPKNGLCTKSLQRQRYLSA